MPDLAGLRPPTGSATAAARTRPSAACGIRDEAGRRPSTPSPSSRSASASRLPARPPARRRRAPARSRHRIVRIEEDAKLRLVEILLVGDACRFLDADPRHRARRRDSGCGRRRSPSTRSAGRPRCADSRRCTSRIFRSTSCNRSSCRGSPTRTCASRGTCPGRSGRCRPPRACRWRRRGRPRRRPG